MINKIIYILVFIIFLNNNIFIYSSNNTNSNNNNNSNNNSCISFIDINTQFNQSEVCGGSLETACQNITYALKTCNLNDFNEITLYFQEGQYNISSDISVFGDSITQGKRINILNNQYNITLINGTSSSTTNVIFDLSNSLNSPLFSLSNPSLNSIYVYGITFQNGLNNGTILSSIGIGNNGNSNFTFDSCVFQNITSNINSTAGLSGGAIYIQGVGGNNNNDNSISINITNCIYQNTIANQIDGGFIFIDNEIPVSLIIDKSEFNSFSGFTGGLVFFTTVLSNSNFTFTNSNITQGISNAALFLSVTSIIENVNFNNNTGGVGFGIGASTQAITFNSCIFSNNLNTTGIYIFESTETIQINDCIFENNNFTKSTNATDRNGAITITNSVASIIDSTFKNNNSPYGASILINQSFLGTSINILNSIFESNNATYGSGFYADEANVVLSGNNTFINNVGVSGSAIFCQSSQITFQGDITFTNNVDTSIQSQYGIGCGSGLVCTFEGNPQYEDSCSSYQPNKAKILTPVEVAFIVIGTIIGAFAICVIVIIIIRKVSLHNRYKPIGY